MQRTCESVMSRNVQFCTENDQVSHAARLMRSRNIGLIPVVDAHQRVRGVVTDRDLALRVLAENKPANTQLKSVMSDGPLVTVSPEDSLLSAEEKMIKSGTGRILVTTSEGRLLGIISRSEIARSESRARAGEVLSKLTRGHRSSLAH